MVSRRGGQVWDRLLSSRSDLSFVIAVGVAAALVATLALVLSGGALSVAARGAVSYVVTDLLAVAIPLSCSRAALRAVGRTRLAWWLMCAAGGLWVLGEAAWLWQSSFVSLDNDVLPANLCYLLAVLPAGAALTAFPTPGREVRDRVRGVLGAVVVGGAVFFISRSLALWATFPTATGVSTSDVIYLAYPILDLLLASYAVVVVIRAGAQAKLHLALMSCGFLVYAIGDTAYVRLAALDQYQDGSVLDVAWALGYALFAVAALAPHASVSSAEVTAPTGARPSEVAAMLVYIPLLLVVVTATARPADLKDPILLFTGIMVLVLFGVRQALLTKDNGRLRHDLESQLVQMSVRSKELRQLASENQRIVQSVADGVLGVDAEGRVTFVNGQAAAMLGRPAAEMMGSDESQLFAHPSADGDLAGLELSEVAAALMTGTSVSDTRGQFVRKDGSVFPVELSVGPIHESGQITGAVVVFHDVSARLAVEKMKNEFISVVSHELRTPLTSIRGSLGLLAGGMGGVLTSPGSRMVRIALESSERLTRLIEDMLDLERIESGSLTLADVDRDASSLIATALDETDGMASQYGVKVLATGASGHVRVDPDRIVQTLTNLIGNAIKFSAPGGVVSVSSRLRDGMVEFSVADQGRGVPADKVNAIFERFEQVDSSDSRQRGGTGLGLTISRDIVNLHGGRIWVDTEVGTGATFRFTLPSARGLALEEMSETTDLRGMSPTGVGAEPRR